MIIPRFRAIPLGFAALLLFGAGAAPAWAASSFSLDNVTIDSGGTVYRAARLDVTDSVLSRDEMAALLAGTDGTPATQRLARITAARIATREIVADQKADAVSQTIVYRDVILDSVAAGVIGHASAAGATITITGPQTGEIAGRTGAIVLDGVDLPGLAHLLVEGRSAPDEPARVIVAGGTIADLDVDLPSGGHGHIGKIALRDAGGRALAVPMTSLVDLAPKADASPPGAERRRALSGVLADLLTSQSLGALDLTDVSIQSAPASNTIAKVAAFSLTGIANGRIARTSLDGFSMTGNSSGGVSVAHLAFVGVDLTPLLAAGIGDDTMTRRLPLRFDRIELDGLAATVANVGQPLAIAVAQAAVEAKDWRNLAPQALSVGIKNFAFDLPVDDPRSRPLLDLGYKRLDVSFAADAAYDAAKTDLAIRRVSLSTPDTGSIDLGTMFSNVGADLFGRDTEKARAALAASLFKHADVIVRDSGLLSRMIDTQARRGGGSAADVRARWASGVRGAVMAFLADNADRGAVADEAERFVRNGGRLALSADAPGGLGLIDAMLAGGLQPLLGKLKFSVGN